MGAVWHFIANAGVSIALTAVTFLGANLTFAISGRGNPRAIKTAFNIRKALRAMPPGTVLECRERRVSAIVYDRERDTDSAVPFYTAPRFSSLAWSTGPRSARSLYSSADATLAATVGALLFVYIPLLAVGVYLAVDVSWLWWFAVVILIGAEVVMTISYKFFYLRWRAFGPVVPAIFLHRYDVYSLPVACTITFGLILFSMAVTVWAEHSSAFE